MPISEAISSAYKLASKDKLKDTATHLRDIILSAFKKSTDLPWPPTSEEIDRLAGQSLPEELGRFMNLVIAARESTTEDDKTQRLVFSIGQDICRAVTNGQWKLPKHILLCNTIRHLYRSKKLTTILNRLGHCESYSFGEELETAMAEAIDEVTTYLTPQILTGSDNVVFHSAWDNLNEIKTNVIGNNVVNSAGGIMLQEVTEDAIATTSRTLPLIQKTHKRSLTDHTPETIPPLCIPNRDGPRFPETATFTTPIENEEELAHFLQEYYVWFFCRSIASSGQQIVPARGGFISATGSIPLRKTTIDYYTPIQQPITRYETVQELLERSAEATSSVGQTYTINTFDLGVIMKALPIVWKSPEKFEKHIIMIGPFHAEMNYIGMLTNHKARGSGYAEILLEAQLVTSGCLKHVLSGKAFAKALFCLNSTVEALERLLLEVYCEQDDMQIQHSALLTMIKCCTKESLDQVLADQSTGEMLKSYLQFQDDVRKGSLGKTAQFWLSFMDNAKVAFMLIHAVKINNRKLFSKCMGEMAILFFAYDGQNYSRFLTWFEIFLTNIESTHPGATALLEKGVLGAARSLIPGSLSGIDRTMKETFMRFAKGTGGLHGLFDNYSAYQRWCRTTSERGKFF